MEYGGQLAKNGVTIHTVCYPYIYVCFYFWTDVHFVEPLISSILDFVLPSAWVSKPGWFTRSHTYMLACGGARVTSGATPAFSTNRGVHCISVYTAGPSSIHLFNNHIIGSM